MMLNHHPKRTEARGGDRAKIVQFNPHLAIYDAAEMECVMLGVGMPVTTIVLGYKRRNSVV